METALQLRQGMSQGGLASTIDKRIASVEPQSASSLLTTAELLRQAGDYRAEEYYEQAIAANPAEPAYELFYADYLRNFRGPLRPLLAEAALHYFAAIEKLRHPEHPNGGSTSWARAVRDRTERGLVALYQQGGIPLAWRNATPDLLAPWLFFSPMLRYAQSISDLDEVHDARDFTAEARFAGSASGLNRPLTTDELRGLVRRKQPEEAQNRLRLRLADSSFDLVYANSALTTHRLTTLPPRPFQPRRAERDRLQRHPGSGRAFALRCGLADRLAENRSARPGRVPAASPRTGRSGRWLGWSARSENSS